jgi:hypothetical protein
MNKLTASALGALLVISASAPSWAAEEQAATGQLGQRYFEVSGGYGNTEVDFGGGYDYDTYGLGVGFSLPVVKDMLDIRASYAYGWVSEGDVDDGQGQLKGLALLYANSNGFKPFVGAGLGWTHSSGDSAFLWAAAVGCEIPVGKVSLTPMAVYSKPVDSDDGDGSWHYELDINWWLSERMALAAGVILVDEGAIESKGVSLGLRFKM